MRSRPLRVLHVLAELKPSGAETMLVAAAPLFRASGVEAEVLSTGAVPGSFAERFRQAGYRVHHLPFSRSPGFLLKERSLMRAGQYDVIHLHCEQANFYHGLAAWSAGPNIILRTIHNAFAFTGNLRWRRGIQRRLLHTLGIRHVSISSSVKETEVHCYGLPTTLVWNWYDSFRFVATTPSTRAAARASFDLRENDFAIVSIGNCSDVKNHASLIRAMAQLSPAERPIYLHVGVEETDRPERKLAQELEIQDRTRFLGLMHDVLPILQAADAFVMPSLYEGFGIAAIEALATGLPALFADVAGLRDFRPDFPHLVYTGTSVEEIAEGLLVLIRMPSEQRTIIRQKYPAIASRLFGMERGVTEYLSIYRGLTNAHVQ